MFHKTVLTLFAIFLMSNAVTNVASKSQMQPSACDLFSSRPVSYPTPSPINVITKDAIEVETNSSVILKNPLFIPFTVKNSGYALEGFDTIQALRSHVTTFGGVLCGRTYIFYKIRFIVSDDPNNSSYSQINGKGSPLTLNLFYYKKEYGTFEEALKYCDGVVMEDFLLDYTDVHNILFDPVQLLTDLLLIEPGSQAIVPSFLAYAWFDRLPFIFGYYAYYGSYIDFKTGKQYPCAITLLADRIVYGLGKKQFENSFLKLKNIHGGRLMKCWQETNL